MEDKLIEETNYTLELVQSKRITEACANISNLLFPNYFPDFSCEKILTMQWMEGIHLSEYCKKERNPENRNKVGQALWDFYFYQLHTLREVHADPHPGNFLVNDKHQLIAIDFGCIKQIPEDFYTPYFDLVNLDNLNHFPTYLEKLKALEIIRPDDTQEEIEVIADFFYQLLYLFTSPLRSKTFDFSNKEYFSKIAELGESFTKNENIKKLNGNRGSRHFLYMNRTFFGLYNLLHDLQAHIVIQ